MARPKKLEPTLEGKTVRLTPAEWEAVRETGLSANDVMRQGLANPGTVDTVTAGILDRLTAERDAALKLAKAAEENVARLEADAVRIPPVPSVDTVTSRPPTNPALDGLEQPAADGGMPDALDGLEQRMTERASAVGMSVDEWLRGLVEITLDRPIPGSKVTSKGSVAPPSNKHLERDPSSRFASLKVAPADSPNVKWRLGEEPGPPAWMTAPTTKPGMTRDQALGAGMEAARIVMGGKAA